MSTPTTVNITVLRTWVEQKLTIDQFEQQLTSMGFDESSIKDHLDTFKKLRYEKRRLFK